MLGIAGAPTRSRFGKRFTRRGQMHSKMGNVTYYKGYGSRNEGVHTNKGAYVVRPERLMNIVAPDLKNFDVSAVADVFVPAVPATTRFCKLTLLHPTSQLKPYVHRAVQRPKAGQRVPDFAKMASTDASKMQ